MSLKNAAQKASADTQVSVKFGIDFSKATVEDLQRLQKLLTSRKKELVPPPPPSPEKLARRSLAKSMMNTLLGFNKAFNCLKSWYNVDSGVITTPDGEVYTLAGLGVENVTRFNFLMVKLANITPFFSIKKTSITPQDLVNQLVKVSAWDDAKFASQQRAGITAREKLKAGK